MDSEVNYSAEMYFLYVSVEVLIHFILFYHEKLLTEIDSQPLIFTKDKTTNFFSHLSSPQRVIDNEKIFLSMFVWVSFIWSVSFIHTG